MSREQRIKIKFFVKLGKTAVETLSMLKDVYGNQAMFRTQVYEWHKRFKSGRDDVEDNPKPGHPTTSRNDKNIQNENELVHSDRRITVRMLAEELGVRRTILTEDLGMKICANIVPKLLSDYQKASRVDLSRDVFEYLESNPEFLDDVITGDKTWVFQYVPEIFVAEPPMEDSGISQTKKGHHAKVQD